MTNNLEQILLAYERWLLQQPLAKNTQAAYSFHVRQYGKYLATSPRDQAIARLLFYTGLRLGECAALNVDDVRFSARKGLVIVRSGKGDA